MDKLVIDVSYHQGTIDWEKVKASGIYGAILRCGYGMDMESQDDKQFARNASECERLGIPYGVYLYSYADNNTKAESEAAHVLRLISGKKLFFPVYYDLEQKGTENGAVERARIFCEKIKAAGYLPGVYANKNWWDNYLVGLNEYTKWVARYNDVLGMDGVDMWQYSSKGQVNGISGNVDVNHCYRDFVSELGETSIPDGAGVVHVEGGTSTKVTLTVKVDGKWGKNTTKALQFIFGTPVDGIVSHQYSAYRANNPGLDYGSFQWEKKPSGTSTLIKAMQGCLNVWINAGLNCDGHIGPKTIKAIQAWLGSGSDGKFDKVSPCIKKLQEWINAQNIHYEIK